MRRNLFSVVLCVSLLAPALLFQTPSSAAPKRPLKCERITANTAPGDTTKRRFRYCSGHVLSKDGTSLLDASVTMPAKGKGPFPLMVILHGLTQSKKTYESDPSKVTAEEPDGQTIEGTGSRYHYNNLWFASKGYMVLTYTARGWKIFQDGDPNDVVSESSCKKYTPQSVDGLPDTMYPGFEPACYIQIAHLKYEIADTQYLVGRLVDGTLTDARGVRAKPKKIGVTGISYGGGQTWMLTRKNVWRSPKGTQIRVDGAAPIIGWTDIADALLPNGRRFDTETTQSLAVRKNEPIGVKNDYVDVFYAGVSNLGTGGLGQAVNYLKQWKDRVARGEPYAGDEIVDDAVHKLLTKRSAYFIPKKSDFDTPIFAVQAFTDGIFPALQSIRMFNRLQAERNDADKKKYPISMYLGDWGHSSAQSKQDEWEFIANSVNGWMSYHVKDGANRPPSDVEARTTVCDGGRGNLGDLYRGASWSQLNNGTPYDLSDSSNATIETPADDPHDDRLVPNDGNARGNINSGPDNSCRTTDTDVDPQNFSISQEVTVEDGAVRMLGLPRVEVDVTPDFDEMYLAARLWDVDPGAPETEDDDEQTLVTRGVFRLGDEDVLEQAGFQLFGNAYTFPVGHSIKLELTADDSPSWQQWRQNNAPAIGTIDLDNASISIPTANCQTRLPECDLD